MRHVCFRIAAVLFVVFALSSADGQDSRPEPKKPRRTQRPFLAQELYAAYWTLEPGWHTELQVRNNLAFRDLTVTPVLRTFDGAEVTLDPLSLKPDEIRTVDLADAVGVHAPGLLHKANSYGSVLFRYSSPDQANIFAASMVHSPGKPISLHFDAEPTGMPNFDRGSFESMWWLPSENTQAYLVIANSGPKAIQAAVSVSTGNAAATQKSIALGPGQVRRLSIREMLGSKSAAGEFGGVSVEIESGADKVRVSHFAMDEVAGSSMMFKTFEREPSSSTEPITTRAAMIALRTPDPSLGLANNAQLTTHLMVRNTSSVPIAATGVLNWKSAAQTGSATINMLQLAPQSSQQIDLAPLFESGAIPKDAQWGSLALSYSGGASDLIGLAITTDDEGRIVAQTPFSEVVSGLFKGSAWYSDANRNSLITLGNGGGETTEVAAVLYFNGGTGQYEVRQQLAPGRQMWIDVAQLIRSQMPDAAGRTIPLEVTTGSYELRAVKQTGVGNLFEGKLTIDKTYGYAAYGCAVQCCWYDPTINPNPFTSPVGTGGQDTAWSECSANGLLYDVTSNTNPWSSTNTSVATLSGIGYVNLVGAGSSTINTSIYLDSILKPYCKPSLRPGSGGANGKPTITGPQDLWWFGGENPGEYPVSVTLHSTGGNGAIWGVTAGAEKVTITPTGDTLTITSSGSSFSSAPGDVTITVQVNSVTSDPFHITTRKPTYLVQPSPFTMCDTSWGYWTTLSYVAQDQLFDSMVAGVTWNEKWNSPVMHVYPNENWGRPPEQGASNPGQYVMDNISGPGLANSPTNIPTPTCGGSAAEVQHWGQEFRIGTQTSGNGVLVHSDTLVRFNNHGEHQ